MKKKTAGILAMVTAALIIVTVILLIKFGKGHKDGFSIIRYAIADIKGVDGRGKISLSSDTVGLYAYFVDDDMTEDDISRYEKFISSVSFTADTAEGLSNGDTVTVTARYDEKLAEELNIGIAGTSWTIPVAGLREGTCLDAFENLRITTGGISPFITVTYINNSDNEYLASLSYEISRRAGLAIGDVITVTCLADEDYAAEQGYYFEKLTEEYRIERADVYISEPEDLDAGVMAGITADALDNITELTDDTTTRMTYLVTGDKSYLYRDNNEEAVSFEIFKAELAYNVTEYENSHQNYVMLYFKGQIRIPDYSGSEDPYEYIDSCFCYVFYDAVRTADGEFYMAVNDLEQRYLCGRTYEEVRDKMTARIGQGYEYSEINIENN